MRIGYAFWGFLGDNKYDSKGNKISTPDGNAFYSWSIIKAFQDRGDVVYAMMPDRDDPGVRINLRDNFSAWCQGPRVKVYNQMIDYDFDRMDVYYEGIDMILLEWRWLIDGRNNLELEGSTNWQPDLKLRNQIIALANDNDIPLVVFDLDYKLTEEDIEKFGIKYVIELGNKWKDSNLVKSKKVYIPFDFDYINEFSIRIDNFVNSLVYVGNRYERDWCIDKYIPEDLEDCTIYGNWKESGRDSESRWNKLNFGNRLQTADMYDVYSRSIATILLAKKEYCYQQFMTARIIESVFYGCVPIFIEEYGHKTIEKYAGRYAKFLTASSKDEVKNIINELKKDVHFRRNMILYLREHLKFMDSRIFVDDLVNLVEE